MTTLARSYSSPDPAVIVASANSGMRQQIIAKLLLSRIAASEALGGADALGQLESTECRLLLLDRRLPDLDSEELLHIIHARFPGIDVLLLDEAGEALLPGEWRSPDAPQLLAAIARGGAVGEVSKATPEPDLAEPLPGMLSRSTAMEQVFRAVRLVAARETAVLITGDTGTGKELIARAVHDLSPRAGRPMITVNCAAIPEALLEAELFGYARGAFTGALQATRGRIQSADSGTLFLDEIGELSLGMQAKLLRFMDQGEIQRLGSADVVRANVRVVAATNADLAGMAQRHEFRQDLYYRLSVFPIQLPSLAQRREDVGLLANHFLSQDGCPGPVLSPEAVHQLERYSWPGNVRELRHVIERAIILAGEGPVLPEHLLLPVNGRRVGTRAEPHFA